MPIMRAPSTLRAVEQPTLRQNPFSIDSLRRLDFLLLLRHLFVLILRDPHCGGVGGDSGPQNHKHNTSRE